MRKLAYLLISVLAFIFMCVSIWSSACSVGGGNDDDADDDVADDDNDDVTPPPDAPSELVAEMAGYDSINLTWKDNSDNENGFYVDRSTDGQSWDVAATVGANTTQHTDTNLFCRTFYYYHVRAFNDGGPSLPSNTVFISTDYCPFQPPRDVEATAQGPFLVKLTWVDQSDEESGYIVERSTNQVDWAEVGRTPRNATGYDDSSVSCEKAYYYRVAAYRQGEQSDYSNIASATTDTCPPCADENITCNASDSGTTVGQTDELDNYSCISWNESGPEYIYKLDLTQPKTLNVSISSSCDLDIFLLTDCTNPNSCLTYGNTSFSYPASSGTYYIVIDGYYGTSCAYSINVGCS